MSACEMLVVVVIDGVVYWPRRLVLAPGTVEERVSHTRAAARRMARNGREL